MEALQKLRKQQAAVRMRATMITASEHCAKSLGANIPPRVTTKPCPSSLLKFAKWSWVSGALLCESLIKSLFWIEGQLALLKICWMLGGMDSGKKTRGVKQAAPVFTRSWYQESLPCSWRETEHFAFVFRIVMDGCGRGLTISGSDALHLRVWQCCRAACSVWEHVLFPSQQ